MGKYVEKEVGNIVKERYALSYLDNEFFLPEYVPII